MPTWCKLKIHNKGRNPPVADAATLVENCLVVAGEESSFIHAQGGRVSLPHAWWRLDPGG